MAILNFEELKLLSRVGDTAGDVSKVVVKDATILEKVGSVTTGTLKFAGAHPYLTGVGVIGTGVVGITLLGATSNAISGAQEGFSDWLSGGDVTNPNAQKNVYLVDTYGKQVNVVQPVDKTPAQNTGVLGWFSTNFMTGLVGDQANADDFMTKAKPWLIGGAVVVGIVAVGYTVKSLRSRPKVILS